MTIQISDDNLRNKDRKPVLAAINSLWYESSSVSRSYKIHTKDHTPLAIVPFLRFLEKQHRVNMAIMSVS